MTDGYTGLSVMLGLIILIGLFVFIEAWALVWLTLATLVLVLILRGEEKR